MKRGRPPGRRSPRLPPAAAEIQKKKGPPPLYASRRIEKQLFDKLGAAALFFIPFQFLGPLYRGVNACLGNRRAFPA